MRKNDLKTGMIVKMSTGEFYVVMRNCHTSKNPNLYSNDLLMNCNGFEDLNEFNDNLVNITTDSKYDLYAIIEVYESEFQGSSLIDMIQNCKSAKLLWKRSHKKEFHNNLANKLYDIQQSINGWIEEYEKLPR